MINTHHSRRSRINDLRIGPNYAPRGTTTRGQRRVRVIGSYLLTWGINGLTEGSAESKRSRLMGQARQSDRMTETPGPKPARSYPCTRSHACSRAGYDPQNGIATWSDQSARRRTAAWRRGADATARVPTGTARPCDRDCLSPGV